MQGWLWCLICSYGALMRRLCMLHRVSSSRVKGCRPRSVKGWWETGRKKKSTVRDIWGACASLPRVWEYRNHRGKCGPISLLRHVIGWRLENVVGFLYYFAAGEVSGELSSASDMSKQNVCEYCWWGQWRGKLNCGQLIDCATALESNVNVRFWAFLEVHVLIISKRASWHLCAERQYEV